MNHFKGKLHSRRGASILLALVFFLLCGFVGSVVLGSAVANAEKLQGRREEQQIYYAVSSAARLLQTALDGAACQGEEQRTLYQCAAELDEGIWSPALHEDQYPDPVFRLTAGDGAVADLLREGAWAVFQSTKLYTAQKPFTGWQRDFTLQAETLEKVQVHMTMDASYTAVFTLQADAAGSYAMTLTCPAVVSLQQAETRDTCQHSYTDPEEPDEEPELNSFDFKTELQTTVVHWPLGAITKGVAAGEP